MLVNMKEMLKDASEKGYAVGGFNCATVESARAAIRAAEELNIPFILQHAQVHEEYMPLELAAPIMLALAKSAKVPVCVHLDHGSDFSYVIRAMRLGFTSVMYDASEKPYEQNLRETAFITSVAHDMGITVEAELGNMPHNLKGEMREYTPEDYYTDPSNATEFAEKTGVDALAISFGTVHGIYKTKPKLSFEVVKKVRESTGGLPLVMHGGSGLCDDDYRNAVKAGIRKINYYTYEALAGGVGVYEAVKRQPQGLLYHDIAAKATDAMTADVMRVMRLFKGER
ncbi:MAG: ketose-bisphosphate aldolase [Eubacteriales bacterium]